MPKSGARRDRALTDFADAMCGTGVGGVPTVALDLPADAMTEFNTFAASCYQQDERCPTGQIVVTVGTDVVSIASVVVPEFEGSLQLAVADEVTAQRVTDALAD